MTIIAMVVATARIHPRMVIDTANSIKAMQIGIPPQLADGTPTHFHCDRLQSGIFGKGSCAV
jgi:hypothetical protein